MLTPWQTHSLARREEYFARRAVFFTHTQQERHLKFNAFVETAKSRNQREKIVRSRIIFGRAKSLGREEAKSGVITI
jgi:hypothetical protein